MRYAVLKAVRRLGGIINIENIPPIFTVFTSSLNDEDARVRTVAATTLQS